MNTSALSSASSAFCSAFFSFASSGFVGSFFYTSASNFFAGFLVGAPLFPTVLVVAIADFFRGTFESLVGPLGGPHALITLEGLAVLLIALLFTPTTYALLGYFLGKGKDTGNRPMIGGTLGFLVGGLLSGGLLFVSLFDSELLISLWFWFAILLPLKGGFVGYYITKKRYQ